MQSVQKTDKYSSWLLYLQQPMRLRRLQKLCVKLKLPWVYTRIHLSLRVTIATQQYQTCKIRYKFSYLQHLQINYCKCETRILYLQRCPQNLLLWLLQKLFLKMNNYWLATRSSLMLALHGTSGCVAFVLVSLRVMRFLVVFTQMI